MDEWLFAGSTIHEDLIFDMTYDICMTFVGVSRDEIACKTGTILNSTQGQRLSVCMTNCL